MQRICSGLVHLHNIMYVIGWIEFCSFWKLAYSEVTAVAKWPQNDMARISAHKYSRIFSTYKTDSKLKVWKFSKITKKGIFWDTSS